MEPFYITTAIDYVNGKPHIGHALEKVQADAIARYRRLKGDDVFFVTGTDEHGAKIARAAAEAGKDPQAFADENAAAFQAMDVALAISYDRFIRTTDQKAHWPSVEKMWKTLDEAGDLYKKQYQGLYCVGHEAFITEKDLVEGICQLHGKAPELVEEENYFFKLSKYTEPIKEAITSGALRIVPEERAHEVLALLEDGLEDVSFSRPRKDLQWGIPVPGDDEHTMYVWADALTNYLSAIGWDEESEVFKKFWPANVQAIGKDILRFHAAIWPGMLLSAGLPLPKTLLVHGFISVDGQKMSKSLGNVIDPIAIAQKYGADAMRYFVLAEIPTTKDGDFSMEKFEARYNGDLALGIGNLVARVTALGQKHLSEPLVLAPSEETKQEIANRRAAYEAHMDAFKINEAISEAMALMRYADKRINDSHLWELPEADKEKFIAEITDMAAVIEAVSYMLEPVMPEAAQKIFERLGIRGEAGNKTFVLAKGESLFARLD